MAERDDVKANRLLLLVGGHPTPNAVAAGLLVHAGGEVVLLHGADDGGGTGATAERLGAWIKHRLELCAHPRPLRDPADVRQIAEAVREYLPDPADGLRLGLHYTGGTKEMSATAIEVIQAWGREHKLSAETWPILSYLDARTLQIRFRPPNPTFGVASPPIRVGAEPRLGLEDVLAIHGWELRYAPRHEPLMPESSLQILSIAADDKGYAAWRAWALEARRAFRKDDPVPLPNSHLLRPVLDPLSREWAQRDGTLDLQQTAELCNLKASDTLLKWIGGGWLESAVHAALAASLGNEGSAFQDVWLIGDRDPDASCQLDVVGIRGHQVLALSCTSWGSVDPETPGPGSGQEHPRLQDHQIRKQRQIKKMKHRDKCRYRFYELSARARQIAGDEAALALVCRYAHPKNLERLLQRELRSRRIAVFGKRHFKDFPRHLAEFVRLQTHP